MTRAATVAPAPARGRHEKEAVEFAARKRDLRRKLESLHVGAGEADAHAAWPHLADADPLIRHAARIALEQRPQDELFTRHDTLPAIGASIDVGIPILARLEFFTGRLATIGDFRAEKLRLNVDPLRPGQVIEIDKREVEEQRFGDTSPMPQGLLDGFTRAEIADLLAFLEDGVRASP